MQQAELSENHMHSIARPAKAYDLHVCPAFCQHRQVLVQLQGTILQMGSVYRAQTLTVKTVGSLDPEIVAVQFCCPPTDIEVLEKNWGYPACVWMENNAVVAGLLFQRLPTTELVDDSLSAPTEHYRSFLMR